MAEQGSGTGGRVVSAATALAVNRAIRASVLTEQEGFRLLFPEEAAAAYDLAQWPWGATTMLGAPK